MCADTGNEIVGSAPREGSVDENQVFGVGPFNGRSPLEER